MVIGTSTGAMGRGSISERLQSNGVEIFRGISGVAPNVAEYWLEATERIMNDFDCTSEKKLKGAVVSATEYERYVRFEDGLWDNLRVLIALPRERDFAALIEKAKIAEDVKRSECQNHEKDKGRFKRDSEPSSSSGRPKKRLGLIGQSELEFLLQDYSLVLTVDIILPVRGGQQPLRSRGQVRGGNGVGRGLKMLGRCVGNSEVRQPSLVSIARRREDSDALDVITGTFLIHNLPYTALIDIGSMHSYIACTVSGTLGIMCESTVNEMTVLSPLGQAVRVNKLFRDVPLEVQTVIFLADLMELPFGEFDLILGMDWLVKHRASLDCAAERIVLKTIEDEEVAVIGERRDFLSNVISALRAEKLVRKGCEAFLSYIGVSDSEGPSVEDVRTVKDFFNVFPDEIHWLPPSSEVEFRIELLPGTALVSIAPCRMAPNELVELKAQIQELFD
ncbi:uncharacterized protein [Gossypium hirsutum]|uniref:DNA/RNA polymerases superfamily protein n=1 Tax=Gossypium hirsutum TaxID=3635 RepID=A0A1U8IM83_GOSHI|nr:uncharacterized protein LOC107898206 [Gossypium hirsutum]